MGQIVFPLTDETYSPEADYPVYHAAAEAGLGAQAEEARVRYVPVSQISTPPTLTTTSRPYGEIVNQVTTAHDIIRLNVSKLYLILCLSGVLLCPVPGVEAEAGGQQEQGSEAGG